MSLGFRGGRERKEGRRRCLPLSQVGRTRGSVDFWRVIVNSGEFYRNQYDVVRCFAMDNFFFWWPKINGLDNPSCFFGLLTIGNCLETASFSYNGKFLFISFIHSPIRQYYKLKL